MKKRILESLFNKKISHLILHVTNRCNLRCKTCFVDFDKYKGKEISLEEIKKTAKDIGKLIWLDISGGEPFLRKDLPEICACFDAKSISIPTNGFNPKLIYDTTKKIRKLVKCELNVSISVDGFDKTNSKIRNKGCFDKSIETIKLLKKIKGVRIKVNTVLCEYNYNEMVEFMRFVKDLDIDAHSIIFLRGSSRDPKFKLPPYDKLQKIKKEIFKIWNSYNFGFNSIEGKILTNYQKILYNTSLKVIKEKKQIPPCVAWKKHLVIYSEGDIAFCEMLPPFGNIRRKNLKEILKSESAKKQREMIKKKKCFCYHNCNMLDNFFLSPKQYPKLLVGIFK